MSKLLPSQLPGRSSSSPRDGTGHGFTKRRAVYCFLAERLSLELPALARQRGGMDEREAEICERELLCVFNETHPRPAHALGGAAAVSAAFEGLPRIAASSGGG